MRPIIVDMNDMSDSAEIYEARPNPFLIYTIYFILLFFSAIFIWMLLFKMETVVKSNGIFRCSEPVCEISCAVTGRVRTCNVKQGQAVSEGDILFSVEVESLGETIKAYQDKLETIEERLKILDAYEKSLTGNEDMLAGQKDNIYYDEFVSRRQLFLLSVNEEGRNIENQTDVYQGSVDNIAKSISTYEVKRNKLEKAKNCIYARVNEFGAEDSYYNSMVNSYISGYSLTETQYDGQIEDCNKQISEYERQIRRAKKQTVSQNGMNTKQLEAEKEKLEKQVGSLRSEKQQALANLELQQIAGIEQQIEAVRETILSLQSNEASAKLQLSTVDGVDFKDAEKIKILTEKGNVSAEILSYEREAEECRNYLKTYDIQNGQCNIIANASGYFYAKEEVKKGSYLLEGTSVGNIYPEETNEFYADIYVGNRDIAEIREGQSARFEIEAYPSSEYGYFTGTVIDISKDIFVEEGSAYYLVKVKCDGVTIQNKEGKTGTIMNGMACVAKIVVEEENVLRYCLRKIRLVE